MNLYFIEREAQQQQQEKEKRSGEEFRNFFTSSKGPTVTGERQREMDKAFFTTIFMDYQPLCKGERKGMRHFTRAAQSDYTTPCYNSVWDMLMPHALKEI